jgi:bifunctional non-homologous end joining protein LigD
MTFDLDPGPDVDWAEVVESAREVGALLAEHGLESFVKTTGGKGLHVVVPLAPPARWEKVKEFALGIAEVMASRHPDRYTATVAKRNRKGRIFVDYLRNTRGATAVAAYSARARAGAPVSTPLAWEEVGGMVSPARFTVSGVATRVRHLAEDPWGAIGRVRQKLPRAPKGSLGERPSSE